LKEIDRIQGSFCKNVLRIPKCATTGDSEMEMGRESRRYDLWQITTGAEFGR
jgi:hypothetical protein